MGVTGLRRLGVGGWLVGWLSAATVLAGCVAAEPTVDVPVTVLAGPVCPVVTDPPDPDCDDRPVAGAELVVVTESGRRVASARTDPAGRATLTLPVGSYTVRAQPVAGLMGTPAEVALVVDDSPEPLTLVYDTGIR